ncbi:hypothetical protein AK88_05376 [Plasmodium fragile]|uniref:Schizont-infected cell agglutination extracellular alpha domain-containing protein n=1 Tax=Plasmodium fragile TaxID=5857 RepID=A0A0D9QDE1_PLAFR|nr:uncharacterized protein AK88_05376 [Plasmodium fragile]KJP84994.1 hypothetical protein AK88_05376 [Plasmodium fragile]
MSAKELGDILRKYAEDRKLPGNDALYQGKLWEDIKRQMEIFITDMKDDSEYQNAKNCENAYWEHPIEDGQKDRRPREMSRSTERVICRLMTQAIYFANAWTKEVKTDIERNSQNDTEIKGLIRCTIADIYQDILREDTCEGWWGTYYAWYVVDQISGALKHKVREQHCKKGKYKTIELNTWNIRNKMKTWLKQNEQMKKKIEQEHIGEGCTGREVKTREQLKKAGAIEDQEAEHKTDDEMKHTVKQHAEKILGEVQTEMEKEQDQLRASTGTAPTDPDVEDADEKKAEDIEQQIQQAIEEVKDELNEIIAQTAAGQAAAANAATTPSKASPAKGATPQTGGSGDDKTKDKGKKKPDGASNTTQPSTTPPPPRQPKNENDQAPPGQGAAGDDVPQPAPAPRPPAGSNGPARAKPAPATPAPSPSSSGNAAGSRPAKPVAAKPVATKDTTATKTRSSRMAPPGAGGNGGKGAAAGGQHANGKTANTEDHECEGDRINKELETLNKVLAAFVTYMQNNEQNVDAIGANCYNSGWNDFGDGKAYHKEQTVADVVRCRFMTLALFFAND